MPGKKIIDPRPQGYTALEIRKQRASVHPDTLPYKGHDYEWDSMGFRVHGHSMFVEPDTMLARECRRCRIKLGLPVGYLVGEEPKEYTRKMARPPQDIHIKDVETALHNLFCQDTYKIKSILTVGDLFDSHRKAARGLIDQLKMQGIKMVPDPDFEDKPPVCKHWATKVIWDDDKKPLKDRVRVGTRCTSCKKEAKFA